MLGNLISPKMGLSLLRSQIENDIKKEVSEYSIAYDKTNEKLFFIIDDTKIIVDDHKLLSIINSYISSKIKDHDKLSGFKIEYKNKGENIELYIYSSVNENKLIDKYEI